MLPPCPKHSDPATVSDVHPNPQPPICAVSICRAVSWSSSLPASPNHAAIIGTVKNSESHQSTFVGYEYRPFHWQPGGFDVGAGVAVALINGYPSKSNGGFFVAPLPMVSIEGKQFGANVILIPNIKHGAALALQLKLKVW